MTTPLSLPCLVLKRHTIESLPKLADHIMSLGILAIMLFPKTPDQLKTDDGREALNENNLVGRALKQLRQSHPELLVITDVALDPYTSHGHDGLFHQGEILNDETTALLVKQALLLAQLGAAAVAPSDMMDGRVGAIRTCLEKK